MKKMIILAGLMLMLTIVSAQDIAQKSAEKPEANPGRDMLTKPEVMNNEDILENKTELYLVRLTGRLKLSDEQKEAIRPIALERMKLMDKMIKEKEKNGKPSKEFMMGIKKESGKLLSQINALLTEDQRAEFKLMQKENLKQIREDKK